MIVHFLAETILYPFFCLWFGLLTTIGFLMSPICAVGGIASSFVRDREIGMAMTSAIGTIYAAVYFFFFAPPLDLSSQVIGLFMGGPMAVLAWFGLAIGVRNFFRRKSTQAG